jgi:SAM-dependent methyltransferase
MDGPPATAPTDSTVRFSERAQAYASGRPGYPPAIAPFLARELDLAPDAVIVDLGSGTGLSSRIFLQAGFRVIGVEPNDRMRAQAEQILADAPGFASVAGTAQATTLEDGSADCVIAAQAFHWFDVDAARAEALRILRGPPRAALIWNVRLTEANDFARDYERLVVEFSGEPEVRERHAHETSIQGFFGGAHWSRSVFQHATLLDFESLAALVTSTSYLPAPRDVAYAPMMQALRRVFDTHQRDGRVVMPYDARVFFGLIRTVRTN